MNIVKTLETQTLKNLLTLFIAGLLFWLSLTLLLPIIPTYIEDTGATTQQIGVVMGCFAIGLLLSRTKLGQLADYRGRKIVVLIGTLVAGLAPLGYPLTHSLTGLIIIRAFHGICLAAFTTGYSALVVDLSPPKRKGELIGYMSMINPIGMSLGPAWGGFLSTVVGYDTVFIISASLGLAAFILTLQVTESGKLEDNKFKEKRQPRRNFWQLMGDRSLRIPAAVMMQVGLVFGTIITFVPLYIRETNIDLNPGLFYTAAALTSFSMRVMSGKASDRYGRGIFISTGLICYLLSMVLLSFAHTPEMFILSGVLEGAGGGTLIPLMVALMSDRSTADQRGQFYAFCLGGFDLGLAMAGPILGFFADTLGYQGIYLIGAALALQALIIFATLSSKNIGHSLGFALGKKPDIYALD